MADTRLHRGPHPEDSELFAEQQWPALRRAFEDVCWLLDRGYALRSSLALVGDRYRLVQRQRLAVARCACSVEQRDRRIAHHIQAAALAGRELWIDGFNLLVTVEAALAGGVILLGRDGCCRDMASVHGTYREVAETTRATQIIATAIAKWEVGKCRWLLDRPVGNSGRLKDTLDALATQAGLNWEVVLEFNPDRALAECSAVVASSDSAVLDHCERWCNVTREVISLNVRDAFVLNLLSEERER